MLQTWPAGNEGNRLRKSTYLWLYLSWFTDGRPNKIRFKCNWDEARHSSSNIMWPSWGIENQQKSGVTCWQLILWNTLKNSNFITVEMREMERHEENNRNWVPGELGLGVRDTHMYTLSTHKNTFRVTNNWNAFGVEQQLSEVAQVFCILWH